jgi:hypothetical protein
VKKNSNAILKVLFISLAILLVVYFTFNGQSEKKYQWKENYKVTSDQPYGTLFMQKLLANHRPDRKFILNKKNPLHKLLDTSILKTRTDYVFIGQDIYLEEADKHCLLHLISEGNDAFISTVNLPYELIDSTFASDCGNEFYLVRKDTSSVVLNFYNTLLRTEKGYEYSYRFGKKDMNYFWNTINSGIYCDSANSVTPIGYSHPDKVNFLRIKFGKGNLYIHCNPLVFTNYFLTKTDKAEYASSVFSHLEGKTLIWDEYSKTPLTPKSNDPEKNNAPEISPLSYILQQESLRYAWWLLLASAILYTIFTAKRKQSPIPVLEEKRNTSLEFINMVSALHFQNANHRTTGRKKIKYFYYFIKEKYGLHTQSLTELNTARLAEKAKVDLSVLQSIMNEFNYLDQQSYYDENRLDSLHHVLQKFYRNCK